MFLIESLLRVGNRPLSNFSEGLLFTVSQTSMQAFLKRAVALAYPQINLEFDFVGEVILQ